MSRDRSGSSASASSTSLPLILKIYRLSRPTLSIAHDNSQPELPPLPQTELVLPKTAQPVYVGEQFQCLLVVQRNPASEAVEDSTILLKAEAEAPDGSRTQLMSDEVSLVKHPEIESVEEEFLGESAVTKVAFELSSSGAWTLRASARYVASGGEDKIIRRAFRVDAAPAISVRTKISKGSSALKAHVLEAQVENLSESALVIESCAINTENGWESTAPDSLGIEEFGAVLRPRDVSQWSFTLRGGWAPEAGHLAIGWRREPLGAKGWQTTGTIRI